MPINALLVFLSVMCYIINNLLIKRVAIGFWGVFFYGYFNDIICPILFMSYVNLLLMTRGKRIVSFGKIMAIGLCTGLFWELFSPVINASSVKDPMDLLCYLAGSTLYYLFIRLWRKKNEIK
jgi:hypothetical protein